MIVTFWQRSDYDNYWERPHRVHILAESIMAIEEVDNNHCVVRLVGGPDIDVCHSAKEIVNFLSCKLDNWTIAASTNEIPEPYTHSD